MASPTICGRVAPPSRLRITLAGAGAVGCLLRLLRPEWAPGRVLISGQLRFSVDGKCALRGLVSVALIGGLTSSIRRIKSSFGSSRASTARRPLPTCGATSDAAALGRSGLGPRSVFRPLRPGLPTISILLSARYFLMAKPPGGAQSSIAAGRRQQPSAGQLGPQRKREGWRHDRE